MNFSFTVLSNRGWRPLLHAYNGNGNAKAAVHRPSDYNLPFAELERHIPIFVSKTVRGSWFLSEFLTYHYYSKNPKRI
jgi:hypothetical protein